MTSVNAEANVHSADWLMDIFVNELAPPHVRSQQGQCVRQCRRIMKDTLDNLFLNKLFYLLYRNLFEVYLNILTSLLRG